MIFWCSLKLLMTPEELITVVGIGQLRVRCSQLSLKPGRAFLKCSNSHSTEVILCLVIMMVVKC